MNLRSASRCANTLVCFPAKQAASARAEFYKMPDCPQHSVAESRECLITPWSVVQLYFQDDCCEKPLELAHKLKLYTDDDRHPQQSSKKPVGQLMSCAGHRFAGLRR